MDEDGIRRAEDYLRQAVYRAREAGAPFPLQADGTGACGLGKVPEQKLRDAASTWIAKQDAFDRARNHFLKDFRGKHGFDRGAYAPEVLAEYEAGLARIAREEDAARRRAAEELAAAGP